MFRSARIILFAVAYWLGTNSFVLAHPGHDHGNAPAKPANLRTWKEAGGVFELQASFVAARDGNVQLRKADGKLVTLEIKKLSHDDQHWIEDRLEEIRKLNERSATQAAHAHQHGPATGATKTLVAFAPEAKVGSGKEVHPGLPWV